MGRDTQLIETDRAWAAGLYDGEGSTCPNHHKNPRYTITRMCLEMCDEFSVRRFHQILGVGFVYGPTHRGRNSKHSPTWTWKTSAVTDVDKTIEILWPYLGEVKKQQIMRVRAHVHDKRTAARAV